MRWQSSKEVEQQYTTKFVREYVITRGPKTPIKQGEEGSISTEDVKKGLALRENLMVENGKRKPKEAAEDENAKSDGPEGKIDDSKKINDQADVPQPQAAAVSGVNSEDFEF